MDEITYRPIGIIRSPFKDVKGMLIQTTGAKGVYGRVEVFPEYCKELKDIWMKRQLGLAKEIYEESLTYALTPIPTSTRSPTPAPIRSEIPASSPSSTSRGRSLALMGSILAIVLVIAMVAFFLMKKRKPTSREEVKVDGRMEKLEKALLECRISEETHKELRRKYGGE